MSGFHSLAARGLSVFPIIRPSKQPALDSWAPHQTRRATPEELAAWEPCGYNTGVATGIVSGCFVLDLDNTDALLDAMQFGLPQTFTVKTPRGWHYYFQHPGFQVRNRVGPKWTGGIVGWDIRGDGGYVVGPGSHYDPTAVELEKGKLPGAYTIQTDAPIAAAPAWLLDLLRKKVPVDTPLAAYRVAETTSAYGKRAMRAELKILSEAADGTVNDQINLSVFAVAQLVAGGEITETDAREEIEAALVTLGVADEEKAQGTVTRAWSAGFDHPRAAPPVPSAEDIYGSREPLVPGEAPPPPPIRNLALSDDAKVDKASHLAIEYWLTASGASIRYDEFAGVVRVNGEALTDHVERQMWLNLREVTWTKFPWDLFGHTLRNVAWMNRYHPLKQYLDGVQQRWDGTPRIDTWLTDYLAVPLEEYSQAVGALFLTALVRRVREPGAKFDEMLVLEGPQGVEKSSALQALCPDENWFTDEVAVGMTSKELLEITGGKWIVEAPELKGLVGRGVDHVKAFLSRRHDKARMAFDRNTTERGREWVAAATTNDSRYLDDPTGNRRIWPVVVHSVRLDALRAARDQLWAEAAIREASGASIRMPRHLWAAASEAQAERVLFNSLKEALEELLGDMTGRVRGKNVLDALGVTIDKQAALSRRFGETMQSLGWENKPVKIDGKPVRFFVRGDPARSIISLGRELKYQEAELRVV